jgi:hypothetical protein
MTRLRCCRGNATLIGFDASSRSPQLPPRWRIQRRARPHLLPHANPRQRSARTLISISCRSVVIRWLVEAPVVPRPERPRLRRLPRCVMPEDGKFGRLRIENELARGFLERTVGVDVDRTAPHTLKRYSAFHSQLMRIGQWNKSAETHQGTSHPLRLCDIRFQLQEFA